MSVSWHDKDNLLSMITGKIEQADVILDIGCGIMPQKYVRPLVHICCEPFDQYIEYLREKIKNEYDRSYVVVKATWAEAVRLFPPKSVDTVFLIDVIEHLEKDEAVNLLKETEDIARRQVVVFTPLGFLPQHHLDGKDAWGLDGGAWQEHKSGWQPEDFDVSWAVYATKAFHTTDNLGREFEKPYGAFWAIKTVGGVEGYDRKILAKKEKIRTIVDMAIDIRPNFLLNLFFFPMRLVFKIMISKSSKFIYKIFKNIRL